MKVLVRTQLKQTMLHASWATNYYTQITHRLCTDCTPRKWLGFLAEPAGNLILLHSRSLQHSQSIVEYLLLSRPVLKWQQYLEIHYTM